MLASLNNPHRLPRYAHRDYLAGRLPATELCWIQTEGLLGVLQETCQPENKINILNLKGINKTQPARKLAGVVKLTNL